MTDEQGCTPLGEEDLRAALEEMKTYVDITEADLKRIYEIALRHAQRRAASTVPVRDIMTTAVVAVKKDAGLQEAAHLLSENKISGMPVIDNEGRVIGVISEADLFLLLGIGRNHTFRDIVRSILGETARKKADSGDRVEDVMSAPALTVGPDEDIRTAAAILDARRIKRLPVVDAAGKLVGLVSRADLVRTVGRKTS